jgi:hypothetical protein
MAYYNSRTNERSFPPQPVECYPDWEIIDCGCCAGVEWDRGFTFHVSVSVVEEWGIY